MKEKLDSWRSFVKKIPLQGLLCLFILSLSLPLSAQTEARKVTINVKDVSVKEVLEVLKKHSYRLVYSTAVIDACTKKVTLDMKKVPAGEVLDAALKDTDLSYKVDGNVITIKQIKKDENILAQGLVTDTEGKPLPGVAVYIKGSTTGTLSNASGHFNLRVPKNSALLF